MDTQLLLDAIHGINMTNKNKAAGGIWQPELFEKGGMLMKEK